LETKGRNREKSVQERREYLFEKSTQKPIYKGGCETNGIHAKEKVASNDPHGGT